MKLIISAIKLQKEEVFRYVRNEIHASPLARSRVFSLDKQADYVTLRDEKVIRLGRFRALLPRGDRDLPRSFLFLPGATPEWLLARPRDVIEHVHPQVRLETSRIYQSFPESTPSPSILANPPPFMRSGTGPRARFYLEQTSSLCARDESKDRGRKGRARKMTTTVILGQRRS